MRRRQVLRGWSAWLALLCSMASLAELHPAGLAHGEPGGDRQAYFPSASHPDAPHHVEPGAEAAQPLCATCWHRLSVGAAPDLEAVAGFALPPRQVRTRTDPHTLPRLDRGCDAGRAPPAAS